MRGLILLLCCVAMPIMAQERDQTLADIRQDLTVLFVEVQTLKRELSTTSGPSVALSGTNIPGRVDQLEAELARLTSQTEELQNRIDRIVSDGTNRIGDLEFRLVELEGGDISQLGETSTLGGGDLPQVAALPDTDIAPEVQLAVGEQADFDRALAALEDADYQTAVDLFAAFTATYPGGPLAGEAHYQRGQALTELNLTSRAARAYLESFSGSPDSSRAPEALLQLGISLENLGQQQEACITLAEVTTRFPLADASLEAQAARADLGCS
ncbi:MAG: tol-pal system protein YbgF [Pseudomonadota bacterium]